MIFYFDLKFLKNLAITAFSLLVFSSAFADLPAFPENCFQTKSFCSRANVFRDAQGRKPIKAEIFVRVKKGDFPNYQQLSDLFIKFEDWPFFAGRSQNIEFQDSRRVVGPAPENAVRHLARYKARAPWPIGSMEVIDMLEYKELSRDNKQAYAVEFKQVPNFAERKGVKYNYGQLHLLENQNYWMIYFYTDVIPSIDLLPSTAAPFILRSMEDILIGMFKL
jgi:hypothetical protein